MRGEAGGTRGKAGGGRAAGSYPPISAAYWLPPSNPTPYHVPGSVHSFSFMLRYRQTFGQTYETNVGGKLYNNNNNN